MELLDKYFYITCIFVCLASTQILKPLSGKLFKKKFLWKSMLTGGGFPSTHATLTSTITTAIGIREGLTSPIFGLGVALSIIIMYDAMNVRYYAGKNISLTKQIVRDLKSHGVKLTGPMYVEKIKEILGHSKIEVIAGCIWGIVVSVVVNYIL